MSKRATPRRPRSQPFVLEVDNQTEPRKSGNLMEEPDLRFRERDRQQAVLQQFVEEYIGEGRCDERAKTYSASAQARARASFRSRSSCAQAVCWRFVDAAG